MSTAQNKAIVRRAVEALGRGDVAGFLADAADDLTFHIMWAAFPPFHGKRKVIKLLENTLVQLERGAIAMTIENLIVEGDHVVGQAHGKARMKDGRDYNNVYCRVWHIVDGKVLALNEYMNTELARCWRVEAEANMGVAKELALSEQQIEEILSTQWVARIATQGPGQRINLVPMWFGWAGGKIYMYARGQKVINLRRNTTCTILVDRNEKYPELQGIMMLGTGKVLEDAAAEQADQHLAEVRTQFDSKYRGGQNRFQTSQPQLAVATASGSTRRWIVFTPDKIVTWDNTKLGSNREQ